MVLLRNSIGSIAREGIALVPNSALRETLDSIYRSPVAIRAVETAQRVFDRLVTRKWPAETLCRFLSGWHATHGTALFVSGLLIRVLRLEDNASDTSRSLLCRAAAQIGEIIPEDTGVDDIPHIDRFIQFADFVVGDDQWKLSRFAVEGCERFREFVKKQRLSAPIEEAILTTAASENWNTGEYTFLENALTVWLTDVMGRPADLVKEKMAYVTVHAGETELGHFLHALKAWELYCRAVGHTADPATAGQVFERYLDRVGTALAALERVLS
jgi:hypothetical protein